MVGPMSATQIDEEAVRTQCPRPPWTLHQVGQQGGLRAREKIAAADEHGGQREGDETGGGLRKHQVAYDKCGEAGYDDAATNPVSQRGARDGD